MAQVKRLDPARPLISLRGVQIASDFTRIVVGDYGAYIEFSPEQVVGENLRPKFMQETPSRPVKYIWLTTEHGDAKVYHHQCRVQYAEYVPGMHYVALGEVTHSS